MPRVFFEYIDGSNIYTCRYCAAQLTALNQLISRAFQGQTGKAFLFNHVVNVRNGPPARKAMMTGVHVVCDIFCTGCDTLIGWKYVHASEEDQKYKEGKWIIEKAHLNKENWID